MSVFFSLSIAHCIRFRFFLCEIRKTESRHFFFSLSRLRAFSLMHRERWYFVCSEGTCRNAGRVHQLSRRECEVHWVRFHAVQKYANTCFFCGSFQSTHKLVEHLRSAHTAAELLLPELSNETLGPAIETAYMQRLNDKGISTANFHHHHTPSETLIVGLEALNRQLATCTPAPLQQRIDLQPALPFLDVGTGFRWYFFAPSLFFQKKNL